MLVSNDEQYVFSGGACHSRTQYSKFSGNWMSKQTMSTRTHVGRQAIGIWCLYDLSQKQVLRELRNASCRSFYAPACSLRQS